MAKENVAKFFEKLAADKSLAEKIAAADKAYGDKHKGENADEAAKKAAVEAILLPLAKEAGLPFTADELLSAEQEKLGQMEGEISDDEISQAAGGVRGEPDGIGGNLCYYAGLGFGILQKDGKQSVCFLVGGYDGGIFSVCVSAGVVN